MWGWNTSLTYILPSVAIFLAFHVHCHTSVMVLSAGVNGLEIQEALRLKDFINMQREGMTSPSCSQEQPEP